jgi:hypothetical protein
LSGRQAREGEEAFPGFFEAVGDRPALQVPFAQEGLPAGLHLGGGLGVDHVSAVVAQLVVESLRRVRQQVTVLVNRAPLDRRVGPERGQGGFEPARAVDDDELRHLETAPGHVLENVPPPVHETPVCDYATMARASSWSRLNWAGERWPCRSISQCSL